jgi:hypothetical protein
MFFVSFVTKHLFRKQAYSREATGPTKWNSALFANCIVWDKRYNLQTKKRSDADGNDQKPTQPRRRLAKRGKSLPCWYRQCPPNKSVSRRRTTSCRPRRRPRLGRDPQHGMRLPPPTDDKVIGNDEKLTQPSRRLARRGKSFPCWHTADAHQISQSRDAKRPGAAHHVDLALAETPNMVCASDHQLTIRFSEILQAVKTFKPTTFLHVLGSTRRRLQKSTPPVCMPGRTLIVGARTKTIISAGDVVLVLTENQNHSRRQEKPLRITPVGTLQKMGLVSARQNLEA